MQKPFSKGDYQQYMLSDIYPSLLKNGVDLLSLPLSLFLMHGSEVNISHRLYCLLLHEQQCRHFCLLCLEFISCCIRHPYLRGSVYPGSFYRMLQIWSSFWQVHCDSSLDLGEAGCCTGIPLGQLWALLWLCPCCHCAMSSLPFLSRAQCNPL